MREQPMSEARPSSADQVDVVPELVVPQIRGPAGRRIRVAHLTSVDMSLALLLGTELRVDLDAGLDVWGISAPGAYADDLQRLGIHHLALPSLTRAWAPSEDVVAARELIRALVGLRPDVLHTHTPKAGVLGRVLGRLRRVPVVVNTCHGLWLHDDDSPLRRSCVLGVEALASLVSHAELYQNAEDQECLRMVVSRRRSQLVGNGVDLEVFRPDPLARQQIRRSLGVGADRLLVGGVGRRVPEKGLPEFAYAARQLADRADFVWVGGDDEVTPLRADQAAGVRLLGERRDVARIYNALDVFVLPSHREGFSRSAMEAAATGLPMLLSDIRGCREIGRSGVHALFVPVRDHDGLTAQLERLLSDPLLRKRLGRAARARAQTEFDQRQVALRSLRTYLDVASRRQLGWSVDDPSGVLR